MILEEDHQEEVTVISRGDHHEEATIGTISEDHQGEKISEIMMISVEDQTEAKFEETDLQEDSLENLKTKMPEMMVEIGEEHQDKKEDQNRLHLKIINQKNKNKQRLR